MKVFLLTVLAAVLWAASPVLAQTTLAVNINQARLEWQWVLGTAPNDGLPDEFRMKCGPQSKNYTKITPIPYTNPPVVGGPYSLGVRQAISGAGDWFCVVTAANKFAESAPSNEVFFAAGAPPSAPFNNRVVAQ